MSDYRRNLSSAIGETKAEMVLKNASIINVFTQEIETNDIAINGDIIVGIGKYSGLKEIDCSGAYVCPGFIDAHVHIESSMVTPEVFSQLVVKHGVTTVIADPHEITNVLGREGVEFMIKDNKKSVMDIFYVLPSCVPATPFEDNGAVFEAEDMAEFADNPEVLGLGEVMDVPSVISGSDRMHEKLSLMRGKNLDGHCPGISDYWLNGYAGLGINTDHECSTPEEALSKVRRGMYVMLREGSATKNLRYLLPAVNNENYHRFLFCTDDRHIDDLLTEGSIDNCVRLAIKEGLDPIKAITISSFNSARCYGLKDRGAVAPGYKADLVIIDSLDKLNIIQVIKDGKEYTADIAFSTVKFFNSVNLKPVNENMFKVQYRSDTIKVISVIPHSVETKLCIRKVKEASGLVSEVIGDEVMKIAVFERHKNTGKYSVAYLEGLGLKNCAIAQTISHDSHNVISIGDNDRDMTLAVNRLIEIGGGIVIVSGNKVVEELSLPIAGLLTSEDPLAVARKVKKLKEVVRQHGVREEFDPFLTLAFMSLPVIPEVKITPRGLFDYNKFDFIDLFCL